ncbi:sulfatase [Puteibacter caeruleilacunae]|nr:sulfatase [Puteibacter caeruleilacunae]
MNRLNQQIWKPINLLHTKLLVLAVIALLLLPNVSAAMSKDKSIKPNIVLIIADDMGWSDVGYNGNTFFETPNIDKLANDGMILNRFYPGAANCAPSRASIVTGMYTPRHGVYIPQGLSRGGALNKMRWKVPAHNADESFNTFSVSINNVDAKYESLAEVVKKSGYITARMGKWHVGDDNQGFDVVTSNGTIGDVSNKGGAEDRFYSDVHVAERLTDAAVDFMTENKDNPFLLYLAHWEVHTPLAAQNDRISYYKEKIKNTGQSNYNATYAAEVEQVDRSVGRIVSTLDKLGLSDNTMIIYISDNGGVKNWTSNRPLRAAKGTYYEGGIRVPCCVKWPGHVQPGTKTDTPVNGVDFLPTFAEISASSLPKHQPVDGASIVSLLKGKERLNDRAMFFHFPLYLTGKHRGVLPTYDGEKNYWAAVPSTTMIRGEWKLIYYYEYDRYELFNLKTDISEKHNLANKEMTVARRMLAELKDWVKETGAPVPQVANNVN